MKQISFHIILSSAISVVLLTSCQGDEYSEEETYSTYHQTISETSLEKKQELYKSLISRVIQKQLMFAKEYPTVDKVHQEGLVALAREYISVTLSDSIWSHWYGTPWDFYGTTVEPGVGKIACGYFVTTTLQHAGYNIDRVILAQQAASVIITTMCGEGKTKIIGNNKYVDLEDYINSRNDGIYICGLDNQVGFIQKEGKKVYFIHSSGLPGQLKVMKEELSKCNAIQYSQVYYVGDLLSNEENTIHWIKGAKIEMKK
ncbi:MAG: hypothetical protein H6599_08900 [Flavobacteriales bacterium]|nr:hypothetical protein [Flavobacteriales bacterium]